MSIRVATWPSGTRVSWRSLAWGEYNRINSLQVSFFEKAFEIYTLCLVSGPPPEVVTAGIMSWIAQDELEKSPFSGTFKTISLPLEQARAKVTSTYLLSAQAFIASVFKIPFEKMNDWDSDTFLCRLAQAEFVSGVPLNPVDTTAAPVGSSGSKNTKLKKPLTNAQQIAIDRKNNDRPNTKSSGKAGSYSKRPA